MKYMTMRIPYRVFVLLLLPLLVVACDFSGVDDAANDFKLIIGLEPIETSASGKILDAATNELITDDVTITFKGQDAASVIDLYSEPIDRQNVRGGLSSFGIQNERSPSPNDPVYLNVIADADGYRATSKNVVIDGSGTHRFTLYMVRANHPPAGAVAATVEQGETDPEGSIAESFSVSTPPEHTTQTRASVAFSQGTVVQDAAGAPLSGRLRTDLTYFTNRSRTALQALPGGHANGDGTLVTAGFASIEVSDAQGRKARTFSQPLTVTFEVPGETTNPSTGSAIQEGDEIGVWSYESEDGVWVREGDATLSGPTSDGHYTVTYEASHLSWWNAAWKTEACPVGATITVNRNGNTGSLSAHLTGDGISQSYTLDAGDDTIELNDMPPGVSGVLTVHTAQGTAETQVSDLCGGTYSVDLAAPSSPQIDVLFELVPECPGDEVVPVTGDIPTVTIFYRKASAPAGSEWLDTSSDAIVWVDDGQKMLRGELTVPGLEEGETYTFKTTYDGDQYARDVTVTSPEMTIAFDEEIEELCQ